jgi:hypothetical protein
MQFQWCWTFPWKECEMCYFGPGFLNEGDAFLFTFNFFFIEFGVRFERHIGEDANIQEAERRDV